MDAEQLARQIMEAIGDACPMWAYQWPNLLAAGVVHTPDPFTAQDVRDEVAPVLDRIGDLIRAVIDTIHAGDDTRAGTTVGPDVRDVSGPAHQERPTS